MIDDILQFLSASEDVLKEFERINALPDGDWYHLTQEQQDAFNTNVKTLDQLTPAQALQVLKWLQARRIATA